jgi:hypothetical protein
MTKIKLTTGKYNRTHKEYFMNHRKKLYKRKIIEKELEIE